MDTVSLLSDCSRCAALCCMALAFDRSRLFAIDKAAGVACPNLDSCGACTIHLDRAEQGFGGCIAFDCFGAGQRVTQEIFGGRSWIDDPSLVEPMSEAFSILLRAHDHLLLLRQAEDLDLSPSDRKRSGDLRTAVEQAGASAEVIEKLKAEIFAFLASLRTYVEEPA